MKRLLIIEPDEFLAGIYARKFEMEQWDILHADDFADAKKLFKKGGISAMLVEPDININKAEEFIQDVKKTEPELPIFVLSGISEKAEIKRMKAAGADAYLIKGHFVPIETVRKVKAAVK